jgi:hypothetical protein
MDMWSHSQPSHFTLGEKTLVAIKAWIEPKASLDNFKLHKRQQQSIEDLCASRRGITKNKW